MEFNEPILNSFDPSKMVSATISDGLAVNASWSDWFDARRFYVNTMEQTGGLTYTLSLSGARDFAGNSTGTLAYSFTGLAWTAPYIDYIMPYTLPLGKTDVNVDIYGKNDIFSGSVTGVSFGSGVTVGSVLKFDNNHISVPVSVSASATFGPRVLALVAGGIQYKLFDGGFVMQDMGAANGMSAQANPDSPIAGETTAYFLEVPVTKQLFPGDTVEFQFPDGYDVSGAVFDYGANSNYLSGTVQGGTAKYDVIADASSRKVILTLTGSYKPNQNDILSGRILGVKNPSASGSYVMDVTTKNTL